MVESVAQDLNKLLDDYVGKADGRFGPSHQTLRVSASLCSLDPNMLRDLTTYPSSTSIIILRVA
jgi:hypothetical protein